MGFQTCFAVFFLALKSEYDVLDLENDLKVFLNSKLLIPRTGYTHTKIMFCFLLSLVLPVLKSVYTKEDLILNGYMPPIKFSPYMHLKDATFGAIARIM